MSDVYLIGTGQSSYGSFPSEGTVEAVTAISQGGTPPEFAEQ